MLQERYEGPTARHELEQGWAKPDSPDRIRVACGRLAFTSATASSQEKPKSISATVAKVADRLTPAPQWKKHDVTRGEDRHDPIRELVEPRVRDLLAVL